MIISMKATTRSALVLLGMATTLVAQEPAVSPPVAAPAAAEKPAEKNPAKDETDKLTIDNNLAEARLKADTNALRAEVTKLKMEKELLAERLSLSAVKRQVAQENEVAKMEAERAKMMRDAELAKVRADYLTNQLKVVQTEAGIEVSKLQNQIASIEMDSKRRAYADAKPVYLENPLKPDGTLVISDRRIALNGPISMDTAEHITERIDFYNNADKKLPIFIVIDQSPGGSVMAGYQILKAMESSDAPVHVVVKSFAASMAAGICTLAKESYAYPNAVILHHQISSTLFGQLNLTEQAEIVKESQRWWTRLATPVATKMGITTDEFIKRMYTHSTSGDWTEFGEEAQKLKWVNHVIQGVEETSLTKNPDAKPAPAAPMTAEIKEELDTEGKPFAYLPRLTPKDVYFLYNPDGYYRMR
jgi:ATP-dependent Clp protease protease subunit